jgi:capsular exopolysaccharide synthesis family protein
MFEVDSTKGLTTALLGSAPEVVMQKVEVGDDRLHLLTSGSIPANPSELLGSNRMRSLLGALRDEFDIVIVDAPPVLPVTDAVVLSGLTDMVILVTKAHQTTDRQVREAVALLARAGATLGGTVLNKVDMRKSRYGYGYGQRYGYRRYGYGGYGHDAPSPKPKRPEKVA